MQKSALKRRKEKKLYYAWPFRVPTTNYEVDFTLKPIGVKGLRPLKCIGWSIEQDSYFTRFAFDIHHRALSTANKWFEAFNELGHDHNIIMQTERFNFMLSQPICSGVSNYCIEFYFLNE